MASVLFAVWVLHTIALITPGANTLLICQFAAGHHRAQALAAALGVGLGSAAWAVAAVLGVHLVFSAFPVLRQALQIAGGIYLLYLAFQLWHTGSLNAASEIARVGRLAALRMGLLTNFTNPKSALFFGSVFSTCFSDNSDSGLRVAAVGLVFVNAWAWYSLVAYLFSRDRVRSAYLSRRRSVGKATGALLGSIGLRFLQLTIQEVQR